MNEQWSKNRIAIRRPEDEAVVGVLDFSNITPELVSFDMITRIVIEEFHTADYLVSRETDAAIDGFQKVGVRTLSFTKEGDEIVVRAYTPGG